MRWKKMGRREAASGAKAKSPADLVLSLIKTYRTASFSTPRKVRLDFSGP